MKENDRRVIRGLLVAVCLLFACLVPAYAEQDGPDVLAEGYCVINAKDGSVVFQKNMNERFYPASITKVMTALVTLEHCTNLDDKVVFTQEVMNSISADSSTLHPVASVDEEMTVRDALFGLMMNSSNECASALAVYTAGSIPAFADMMNERAREIGANNTHFVNAHGLHNDDHYTTPYDMALIFTEALKNSDFRYIASQRGYVIPATNKNAARNADSTNSFLNGQISYPGVYAGKTGHTAAAGRTLCTAFYRDGIGLNCVIMKSDNDNFYLDTMALLDHAYNKVLGDENERFIAKDDYVLVRGNLEGGLRLRRFPSPYSAVMSSLQAGERVYRIGTFGAWSLVQADNGRYYAASEYLVNPDGTPTWTDPGLFIYGETLAAPDLASRSASEAAATSEAPQAEETEPEASEEESTEETADAAQVTEAAGQEAQDTRPAAESSYTYQVDTDVLTIVIIGVILAIAVVLAIIGAILIKRN